MSHVTENVNPSPAFWLESRARLQPDRECLVYWYSDDQNERWTYRKLQHSAQQLAAALQRLGVRAGDRVAFLDYNNARFAVLMVAAARIGAIFVPVNFHLSAPEITAIMNDCGASMLIYGDQFESIRTAVENECDCTHFIRAGQALNDQLGPLMQGTPGMPEHPARMAGWDETAWLLYTSGSTASPVNML